VKGEALLRAMSSLPDHEIVSMLTIAATEMAYRLKTSIGDVASRIDGLDPYEPRPDPRSHEVRASLTLAGECWERITGRRSLRRRRLH
jgi:hypothetical protein